MIFLYVTLGIIFILFLLYIFLIFPSGRKKKTAEFFSAQKYFAHRGLHGDGVPENSLTAFGLACKAGYGIEFDVHITADEKLVIFHDSALSRMCGVGGNVEEKTLAELKSLTLLGTDEKIPTLEETLALIDGRAPLIVEIKGEKITDTRVCELSQKVLSSYRGKWCMESFNPFYVRWWKKHGKNVVRGQLACKMRGGKGFLDHAKNFILENLLLCVLSRPDFVAYDVNGRKQPSFRAARALGAYPVAWTIRTDEDRKNAEENFEAVIFEQIRP